MHFFTFHSTNIRTNKTATRRAVRGEKLHIKRLATSTVRLHDIPQIFQCAAELRIGKPHELTGGNFKLTLPHATEALNG